MKKWTIFFISILILGIIMMSYKYDKANTEAQNLQNTIDEKFKIVLSIVYSSFNTKIDEMAYRSALSSVSTAASISEITSYEDQNDNLDVSLYNFYHALRNDESKVKILARADEVRDIFTMLFLDPASKKATDKLMEINDETFFKD
ncbi:hypothetical protein M3223_01985 [Paenibacillus pasadenensis]|uniref:hypothetical protein n=1 Tax=Paenibacillus pasadenensis TaxID=217090 RepID=UPI0020405FAE|nr:hypothetical protein [Paenibacillus pasadenensis]MCM3746119.1 hypothetical protein [Paenibacillus pasadenensis]